MNYPVFLYNSSNSLKVYVDIGLEIPSGEYFEVENKENWDIIYIGNLKNDIENNIILISSIDSLLPPESNQIIPVSNLITNVFGNIDGGTPDSNYGGIVNLIDGGGP